MLVGGLAAVAHGATRATFDIDIVPRWETHNLDALAGALRAANARLRVPDTESPVDIATRSFKHTMRDRFTRKSRHGRGHISRATRHEVYKRDGFTCQFCQRPFARADLTIDHLVPLARGGLDEVTNYVTCCQPCNQRKSHLSLEKFAASLNLPLQDLPVHGDPVMDNEALPIQIRQLRRMIFDKQRKGELRLAGKQAQKKLEKAYRRAFWETDEGKTLEAEFPALPGQVRIMLPEIKTIATNVREFWLLVELAKSARTRNLIRSEHLKGCDIERRVRDLANTRDESLKKRVQQALVRFERNVSE